MRWTPDWNDAFDNVSYVQNFETIPEKWASQSDEFRNYWASVGSCHFNNSYGNHDRHTYDFFEPKESALGTVIIVHGGYWSRFDKSYWSYLARGPVTNGWNVAVISYPLCPTVHIAEITSSVRQAVETIADNHAGPIRLIGHSAGGHLVTRMGCSDSLSEAILSRVQRIVSVSGLYDLRPLINIDLNETLGLSLDTASDESPVFKEPGKTPITFWVGAEERPEFVRQNRLVTEDWFRKKGNVGSYFDPRHDHFSVIDGLADPSSELTKELFSSTFDAT